MIKVNSIYCTYKSSQHYVSACRNKTPHILIQMEMEKEEKNYACKTSYFSIFYP